MNSEKAIESIEKIKAHATCIASECDQLVTLLNNIEPVKKAKKKQTPIQEAQLRAQAIAHLTKKV